jgi:hypothetical protein
MKSNKKNMLGLAAILIIVAFSMSGCVETGYYHTYHHHTREWYGRHNAPPPEGVNFDADKRR